MVSSESKRSHYLCACICHSDLALLLRDASAALGLAVITYI